MLSGLCGTAVWELPSYSRYNVDTAGQAGNALHQGRRDSVQRSDDYCNVSSSIYYSILSKQLVTNLEFQRC